MTLVSQVLDTLFPARRIARRWGVAFIGRDDLQVTVHEQPFRVSAERLFSGPNRWIIHWRDVTPMAPSSSQTLVTAGILGAARGQLEGYFAEIGESVTFEPP